MTPLLAFITGMFSAAAVCYVGWKVVDFLQKFNEYRERKKEKQRRKVLLMIELAASRRDGVFAPIPTRKGYFIRLESARHAWATTVEDMNPGIDMTAFTPGSDSPSNNDGGESGGGGYTDNSNN